MKLTITNNDGDLLITIPRLEQYDLTKAIARADLLDAIRLVIEGHRHLSETPDAEDDETEDLPFVLKRDLP